MQVVHVDFVFSILMILALPILCFYLRILQKPPLFQGKGSVAQRAIVLSFSSAPPFDRLCKAPLANYILETK